jgi:hypothetical protein
MSSLTFCIVLIAFVSGYAIGLKRGTVKTINLINLILAERSGKVVDLDSRRVERGNR